MKSQIEQKSDRRRDTSTAEAQESDSRRDANFAHVLCFKVIEPSPLDKKIGGELVEEVFKSIGETLEFRRAQQSDRLLLLRSGDGAAIVFFRDPVAPVRCALEITQAIQPMREIRIRIGINTGPCNRITDSNGKDAIVGAAITDAQRAMDCADAGHILLTETNARYLLEFSAWAKCLEDLGDFEIPHAESIHLYNLTKGSLGNSGPLTRPVHLSKAGHETPGGLNPDNAPIPFIELAEHDLGSSGKIRSEKRNAGLREESRKWVLPSVAAFVFIVLVCIWSMFRLPAPTRIAAYEALTHDPRKKALGGTDGTRLYLTLESPNSIAEVGITGGELVPYPIDLPGSSLGVLDISPDGSNALIRSSDDPGNPVHSLWIVRILGGSIRRLPNGDDGSFSPDGESILFATRDGDICFVRNDGSHLKKIAAEGIGASHPRQSPDGKVIRFDRDGMLWEMKSNGSGIHPLFQDWRPHGSLCCGRWAPDGSSYFFRLSGGLSTGTQIWSRDERHGLLARLSAPPAQLTTGPIRWGDPIISKDRRTIFAAGQTLRGELSRFDSKTKQFLRFLDGISAEFVSFSKDDKSIAYVSYPNGILSKANRDGSNPVQLTAAPLYPVNPRWSPDGKLILFAAESPGGGEAIYTIPYDGGYPEKLLPQDEQNQGDPNWSPDGRKIVFDGSENRDETKVNLFILDRTKGQAVAIADSAGLRSPRWSPDGRYIAALDLAKPDLRVYDLETKRWSSLPVNAYVQSPEFSRDSSFIYFLHTGRDQGVFRIRATGGTPERIVDMRDFHVTGFYGFSMSLDPTDAPLVLRDTGSDDIYALTLEQK